MKMYHQRNDVGIITNILCYLSVIPTTESLNSVISTTTPIPRLLRVTILLLLSIYYINKNKYGSLEFT